MKGRRKQWVFAALAVALVAASAVFFSYHRRYNQKSFPGCPKVSGETRKWGRMTFLVPEGWALKEMKRTPDRPGRKDVMLRQGEEYRNYVRGITIAEDPGAEHRDEFNMGLEGRVTEIQTAVPGTLQTLDIDGRKAILYLGRDDHQHGQTESWQLLVDGGDTIFEIGGPEIERGYHYLPETCAYWTVVRNLSFD